MIPPPSTHIGYRPPPRPVPARFLPPQHSYSVLGAALALLAAGCHHFHGTWPHFGPEVLAIEPVVVDPVVVDGGPGSAPVVVGPPTLFAPPPIELGGPIAGPDAGGMPPLASVSPGALDNPLFVPVTGHDVAWDLLVDVMDDYFRIAREDRVRPVDGILYEGRIETHPQMAATIPELHRRDSVGRFNRWQSTLQTIRRQATARVVPTEGGYLVEMIVHSELEDLPRPEHATAGGATFRSDSALPSRATLDALVSLPSDSWIPLGRDAALEQQMLADIKARLDVTPPGVTAW